MDSKLTTPQEPFPSQTRKQPSRLWRFIGAAIAIIVLAALGWLAWYLTHPDTAAGASRPGGRGAPATTVGVASAASADIPVELEALGTVTSLATVVVRAQVTGVMQSELFREGDMVKAGQLLATIDPRQYEMALMQATGQRQRDEAQLESAKVTLQRYRTLLAEDSIARQDVDTQAALVKQLEGTVVSDRANEGTARINLGYCRIVAPTSGRIGLRAVDVGNIVNPGDANGIATITQVAPIDVVFSVPQDQLQNVQARAAEGAVLPVTALDRNRLVSLDTGRFSTLDNQVDVQTGTVRAKARFANAKLNLFANQFVNVRLLLRTIQGAVVIPVTALRHGSSGDFVYVLNETDHTVSLRPVTRGQATIDKVEILTGLQIDEKVITEGADRLKDGAKVSLAGDKPAVGANGAARDGKHKRDRKPGQDASAASPASAPASTNSGTAAPSSSASAAASPAASTASSSAAADNPGAAARERRQHRQDAASGPSASAPPPGASAVSPPTEEQRKHMLDQVKDNPEALERRKHFLEQIDKGDPAALERWRKIQEGRRDGAQAPAQ